MHYQPDIPTISKTAPPSYAEAMAQNAMKDHSYAPPYVQPTTTMYDQGCSQAGYLPSAPSNNFYSNIPPSQPPFNTSCVQMESSQQYCRTTTPAIVHVEPIEVRQDRFCGPCCYADKRIAVAIIFIILFAYLIKAIAFH